MPVPSKPRSSLPSVLLAGAFAVAVALALASCGGDGDDDVTTAAATPAATEPVSGSAPTTAPQATPEPQPSPTAAAGDDSDAFSGRLPDLDSYRYSFKLEGTAGLIAEVSGAGLPAGLDPETDTLTFSVEGSYVKPDRGEATISLGDESIRKIVIGDEVWDDVGAGFEGPKQLIASDDTDYSFLATFWDSDASEVRQDLTCDSGIDTVNGVPTHHCTTDRDTIERLNQEGQLFTTGILDLAEFTQASVEFWFAEGDKVIRFRTNLAGTDSSGRAIAFKMEADISDINADFSIDPPS